jgi:hypothetical protein
MRKIYGKCVACIKGKTVRATPGKVINQWVAAAPGERLCIDVFFLSVVSRKGQIVSLPFLIVVDEYTEYVIITWLASRTTNTEMRALTEVIKFYYGYDWCVREICGDRDSIFVSLKAGLLEHKVELDIRATDQKVPRADRMIRTIRDIFRTIKAALWYKPPQFLYPHFMDDAARVWNIRPNSRTVDRSPREIVEGKKLEYDQHIKTPLGTVGEFYIPAGKRQLSKDDREVKKNEERTATGIVIGRNFDPTGSLEIYNIDSGTRVNRCKVKMVRQPSAALKAQIRALTPIKEVIADDMILPVPRITQSTKRANIPPAPIDTSQSSEVTDTDNCRGENTNDASGDVVEQSRDETDPQSTDAEDPDLPVVRSTDDTTSTDDTAAPTTAINIEGETNDINDELEDSTDDSQEVTGVSGDAASNDSSTITSDDTPINNPSLTTNNDDDIENVITDTQTDYPRRPGHRKLTRTPPAPPAAIAQPPLKVRAQRHNRGKQPERYAHMADNWANLEEQYQQYVYTAADNLTIAQAKSKYPWAHVESLRSELTQFHDMHVGKPIKEMVKGLKHNKVIGCKGFYKEVFDLRTGSFKKLKFRIVPHGHLLDRTLYEPKETTSPTVSMESIFACINVAAIENRKGFTMDIPGAYLNAELKDKHVVRFPADLAAEYVALYPEYVRFLQADGTMLMLIEKALYGLVESSALWYNEIKRFLEELGYVVHPSDMGVFQKHADGTITICLWVDDFLGFSTSETLIAELEKKVRDRFGDARFDNGEVLNYIGMTISQAKNGVIIVKQTEYIKKITAESMVSKTSTSPNHPDIMKHKDKSLVKPLQDTKRYLSLVMSAMFAAKRTRPDILTPVCILASRVQSPDTDDMKYLLRVFEYLKGTSYLGLRYKPTVIALHYWIDASYNLHRDSRGHTGIVATVGKYNAPIYVRSQKHKLHTRSSTEAELVATDEGVLHLLWLILVFDFLGYPQQPVTVLQDNQSTMRVCQTGQSKNGRLKHMVVRYNFIHGQQEANIICFEYIKSENMIADIMSKPVSQPIFMKLRKLLLNMS